MFCATVEVTIHYWLVKRKPKTFARNSTTSLWHVNYLWRLTRQLLSDCSSRVERHQRYSMSAWNLSLFRLVATQTTWKIVSSHELPTNEFIPSLPPSANNHSQGWWERNKTRCGHLYLLLLVPSQSSRPWQLEYKSTGLSSIKYFTRNTIHPSNLNRALRVLVPSTSHWVAHDHSGYWK